MARRAEPITLWPGIGVAACVAALVLGPLVVIGAQASFDSPLSRADWAAIRFTLWQAALSAAISLLLALPVARALARRRFPGRGLLITLLGAPFLLPVVVAVIGLIAVFGRSGVLNTALHALGLPSLSIYGAHGVILAHVFFNLPLATRLFLQAWQAIPAERFRLAAQLNFSDRDMWQHFEWPLIRQTAPSAFVVIFAICASSFAVALTLGGGPKATTVELAIYQAFRFDFDLGKATQLAGIQLLIAALAGALALAMGRHALGFGTGLARTQRRFDGQGYAAKLLDWAALSCATLFLIVPLGAVVLRGAVSLPSLPPAVWGAARLSLQIAALSTLLCCAAAVLIGLTAARWRWLEGIGILAIASSPLVIGTGLFLVIFPLAPPQDYALTVTALVNAIMALPFALRALIPAIATTLNGYGRLSLSLNLTGARFLLWVLLPSIRAPLCFAAGLSAALSMGDLGVVALFASTEQATLPLQVYRLMGAYRMEEATGAAILLAGLAFGIFWLFDKLGGARA